MDRWSGKRAFKSRPDPKMRGGVVLRDRLNSNSGKIPSVEKKSINFTRFVGSSDKKLKSVLSTFRSSPNGKKVIGTSSNVCGSNSSSLKNEKQPLSQISMDSSESSRGSKNEAEAEILDVSLESYERRVIYGKLKTPVSECSNLPSSSRIKRGFRQKFGLSKKEFHPGPSGQSASASRGCSSLLSGVIPKGFGLNKRLSRKVDTINKRNVYGESSSSSSARGKDVTEPPVDDNDVTSVGGQRSVNRNNSRIRFSNRGSGRDNLSSIRETEMSQTETSNNLNSHVSLELYSGFPEYYRSSYNLDGIPEELLMMETGLLLGGRSFNDQHRDMRLDIDNMSYEELLALEERIGTVSTALTEEAISKCLKTSIYQRKNLRKQVSMTKSSSDHMEDAKCSICQEEYTIGDEVGRLHCEHTYHVKCVKEWLQMKSWCPICKATAETSSN